MKFLPPPLPPTLHPSATHPNGCTENINTHTHTHTHPAPEPSMLKSNQLLFLQCLEIQWAMGLPKKGREGGAEEGETSFIC